MRFLRGEVVSVGSRLPLTTEMSQGRTATGWGEGRVEVSSRHGPESSGVR